MYWFMKKIENQMKLSGKISFRVHPADLDVIQKEAVQNNSNISEYMRTVVKNTVRKIGGK